MAYLHAGSGPKVLFREGVRQPNKFESMVVKEQS